MSDYDEEEQAGLNDIPTVSRSSACDDLETFHEFHDDSSRDSFQNLDTSSSSSDTEEAVSQNFCQQSSTSTDEIAGSFDETIPPVNVRFSSPVRSGRVEELNLPLSSINECEENLDLCKYQDQSAETSDEKVFDGSNVSLKDATDLAELFCSRFNLSDETSTSLFSLIKCLLPVSNRFPSGYSYVQNTKRSLDENLRCIKNTSDHSIFILKFRFQLRNIVLPTLTKFLTTQNIAKTTPIQI